MARLEWLVVSILLVAALPGCGQRSTPKEAAGTGVTAASVGLKIVAIDGPSATPSKGRIRCPLWYDRRDEVVLGSDRLVLSDDQAAQLRRQWTAFRARQTTTPPDALRQVPGVPTAASMPRPPVFLGYSGTNYFWGPGCALELQITDTGSSAAVISSGGLRLAEASVGNAQRYNLVDACSLDGTPPALCHFGLGGGAAYCSVYSAQVQMTPGASGAAYRSSPQSRDQNGPCPAMTIARGATKELWIQAVGGQPQIYSVVPELEVQTAQGTSTVSLPEFAGTMAFADTSQFSCYQLAGSSLVKAPDSVAIFPPRDPRSGLGDIGVGKWPTGGWCL